MIVFFIVDHRNILRKLLTPFGDLNLDATLYPSCKMAQNSVRELRSLVKILPVLQMAGNSGRPCVAAM